MERRINRRQQGDLGEASAIEWLTRVGATVLIPFGHSPDFDLVAQIQDRLLRIQVKTSTYVEVTPNGHSRYQVHIATNGGNRSWTGVAKRFDPSRADFLFVLTGEGRRWFIPAPRIEGAITINLGGSRYSEFEIEPGRSISELVHGQSSPLESDSRRGSADVGESGETVNLVPRAEWVRIPPPPSAELPARGRTSASTTISANHQITIPKAAFEAAGLRVGDRFVVTAEAEGRVTVVRTGAG